MTTAEPTSSSYFQSVLNWLHKGYPDGVPPKDYYPLLALLSRSLEEDEVVRAGHVPALKAHCQGPADGGLRTGVQVEYPGSRWVSRSVEVSNDDRPA